MACADRAKKFENCLILGKKLSVRVFSGEPELFASTLRPLSVRWFDFHLWIVPGSRPNRMRRSCASSGVLPSYGQVGWQKVVCVFFDLCFLAFVLCLVLYFEAEKQGVFRVFARSFSVAVRHTSGSVSVPVWCVSGVVFCRKLIHF